MLTTLKHGSATSKRLLCKPIAVRGVRAATTDTRATIVKQLKELKDVKSQDSKFVDPRRVNVVSEGLCDDIIKFLGPSIERHRHCDLIDINPGVGIWSQKLHDFLEPRKHVLMEPDVERYHPMLKDLIAKPRVRLLTKSGVVWKDLLDMIRTELPSQHEMDREAVPTRNDTLLVTANLSTFPKKAFRNFDSISTMVIYQFLSSIRHSSLFQRYGLVRMLLWLNDEDKSRLIPRSVNRRRRSAFENEMSCEWFREVAAPEQLVEDRLALRDRWINMESGLNVIQRMEDQGIEIPVARQSKAYTDLKKEVAYKGCKLAGVKVPSLTRPFKQELEEMEQEASKDEAAARADKRKWKRFTILRKVKKMEVEIGEKSIRLIERHNAISRLATDSPGKFEAADAQWNDEVENIKKNQRHAFLSLRDNLALFRHDPPVLHWDRRTYEPMTVSTDEFFPEAPTALVDIQPKAMHPLLRQYGTGTERSGDMSDVMLRNWFLNSTTSAFKAMENLWGGAGELINQCPSMVDPSRGGSPMTRYGCPSARTVTEEQWVELLQSWMDWPFRPSYEKLVARVLHEPDVDVETEDSAGHMAVHF
ncbi:hypothetical protein XA68_17596 [Ophiocordyceps unilateralis]|uniref:rRNA adenine N(6)-methyltransferase n=1 Tax=Ophiocordyceps unilateralis TaxID=268505 RepID=A0A2A9PKC5_OPHUN|nr:hypothetical protein XA68_17596 [Ophiocordyceps unilateralis]